jgi:cytochrome c oxidase assembly protein subunit 15
MPGQREQPPQCEGRGGPSDLLALGFGTTVATWAVGYVGHMPLVEQPTAVLVGLMLGCLVGGGWAAGRYTGRGVRGGAWVGLISAALDLLIFGSLLAQPDSGSPLPHAWLWIPGWFLLSTTLATAGATVGARRRANHKSQISNLKSQIEEPSPNWPAALAWITCAAVLLLLAAGGLVTGFRAGMAVPDWPNTFGSNMFLYPLAQMTGGVFYEHAHRLLGTLAGSAALALAIELARTMPERKALVRCTWILGTAVAVQGVFGGLRVVDDSHCLAVVHGFFAHAILGGLVAVAAILSREGPLAIPPTRAPRAAWSAGFSRERCPSPAGWHFAVLAVAAILLQTLLGTLLRQLGLGLFSHLTLAVGVVLTSLGAGIRAWRPGLGPPLVRRCAIALMLLVVLQIDLGLAAMACRTPAVGASPTFEAIQAAEGRLPVEPLPALVTTAHQTTAAVLLALAVMLAVWACPAGGAADLAKPQAATGRQIP